MAHQRDFFGCENVYNLPETTNPFDRGDAREASTEQASQGSTAASTQNRSGLSDQVQGVLTSLYEQFTGSAPTSKRSALQEIHHIYEKLFQTLSETYAAVPWPSEEAVGPLVAHDTLFLVLYQELAFRHLHAIYGGNVQLKDRVNSFKNYYNLFQWLVSQEPGSSPLDLPNQWIWDLIEEFLFQYSDFNRYKARLAGRINPQQFSNEEYEFVRDHPDIWGTTYVVDTLISLSRKGDIGSILEATVKNPGAPLTPTSEITEAGPFHLSRMLGYYSMIGLLRVHCLLGDYHAAIRAIDYIDVGPTRREKIYTKVVACQVSLFYYTGFALMMLRRYCDAIKFFTQALNYIERVKNVHLRGYQKDEISKKKEQIYNLLGMTLALCPQRVDESISTNLTDKYSERTKRWNGGDLDAFGEYFSIAAPKFSPATVDFPEESGPNAVNASSDALALQKKLFLKEVKQQLTLPMIRSYLSLYSTISLKKLASFMPPNEDGNLSTETFRGFLLELKHKMLQIVWDGGRLSEGERISVCDVDFNLVKDMVHVVRLDDNKEQKYTNHGQWFMDQLKILGEDGGRSSFKHYADERKGGRGAAGGRGRGGGQTAGGRGSA